MISYVINLRTPSPDRDPPSPCSFTAVPVSTHNQVDFDRHEVRPVNLDDTDLIIQVGTDGIDRNDQIISEVEEVSLASRDSEEEQVTSKDEELMRESDDAGHEGSERSEGGCSREGEEHNIDENNEGDNENEQSNSRQTPQQYHSELEKLINRHQKRLRNKKTMLTDTKAAATVFDLEALRNFNDIRLALHIELASQKTKLANAAPRFRTAIKAKLKTIWPTIDASLRVAKMLSKTETYARRLRDSARHLLHTGLLLETNQGKGASHETLLNRPGVVAALRRFVNGLVPVEDGGYIGQVK